jgi:site-specific recombinase XerD
VIQFITDTLSTYFRRAMSAAGINKPGAVHILRHTAITKVSREKGIRVAQHFAGHSDISTTQIYDHVLDEETEAAVRSAFG